MAENIKHPDDFDFESSNLAVAWMKWEEKWDLYEHLALAGKNDEYKRKMLLYCIGEKGREIHKTLDVRNNTCKGYLAAFKEYCVPKTNETVEVNKFFNRKQKKTETVDEFITSLKILAEQCNFENKKQSLIKHQIINGIADESMKEKLLHADDLTLDKCIKMCQASERTKAAVKELGAEGGEDVSAIRHRKPSAKRFSKAPTNTNFPKHKPVKDTYKPDKDTYKPGNLLQCKFCGRRHRFGARECPAWGKACSKCGQLNHFAVKCGGLNPQKTVKTVEQELPYVLNIQENTTPGNKEFATMQILETGNLVKFQLDSGSTCNILPTSYLTATQKSAVDQTRSTLLHMYASSAAVKTVGELVVPMENPKTGKGYRVLCQVVSGAGVPILGNRAAQAMDLISINRHNILTVNSKPEPLTKDKILKDYQDVFTGTGLLAGEYHIELDETVKPVIHPPRRVPVTQKAKLKEELDRLEAEGIIAKVTEPTEWVSSMVVTTKQSGKLRVCLDPQDLNRAIKRSHYPLPTLEDILPDLGEVKVFSVFDARNGFWHIKLDESSSKLTTFNTAFGRYRWIRMPFGISSAPEEYQRRQNEALEGLLRTHCIADDILVCGAGRTFEEAVIDHDKNVVALLNRCRERNLKLNPEKMRFHQVEVPFIGHVLTNEGLLPNKEKVEAIISMPPPTDATGVRRFLGMVTYLGKFIENLSDLCEPLRILTQKDVAWHWDQPQQAAFETLKEKISQAPVLQFYDPKKECVLQCDSSEKGLGAVLLQNNLPVAYASRALSDAETRYAQIEKELLAVVYGVSKFHEYVYGRRITVHSDHKPLENILQKPLYTAPKRLQNMLVQLQGYNIDLQYKPGITLQVADTLSRAYLPRKPELYAAEREFYEVNLLTDLPISPERLKKIQDRSRDDLKELFCVISQGWPSDKDKVPPEIKPYYPFRHNLAVYNGVVFKDDRVVIPPSLRKSIVRRLHSAHIGIEGTLRRARECVFWPGMTSELRDVLSQCEICNTFQKQQPKEPLAQHETPLRPWEKVGVDLASVGEKDFLVCVDYFSNFAEIDFLPDTKAETVIHKLRIQFARHGVPDIVFSDNGPQFSCDKFRTFAEQWQFQHVTSSPAFPQSNGKVENAVKTLKSLIVKAQKDKCDPYKAILDFRNTPTQGLGTSPSQRLFSRRTKTFLPTRARLLQPEVKNDNEQRAKTELYKFKVKHYYDQKASGPLPELHTGDTVRVQPVRVGEKEWIPGTVESHTYPRSYDVRLRNGRILRRNRKHLRKTNEKPPECLQPAVNTETRQEHVSVPNVPGTPRAEDELNDSNPPVAVPQSPVTVPQSPRSPPVESTTTRSGRLIKRPARFED